MKTIRKLTDDDLTALHHMLRRDDRPLREIALWVESHGVGLGRTESAKIMAISRYRKAKEYQRWLKAWENRDADLKRDLALQKQSFEYLSSLVSDPGADAMANASKALQARLLTIAAKMNENDLQEAMTGGGWLKNLIAEIRAQSANELKSKRDETEKLIEAPGMSREQKIVRLKEIFDRK